MSESSPAEEAAEREQLSARNAVKLRALARAHLDAAIEPVSLGAGAVALDGGRCIALLADVGLGSILAWARKAGASEIDLVSEHDAPVLARQASYFGTVVRVWEIAGSDLRPAEPAPFADRVGPPDAPDLVAVLEAEGLDVVVEGDRLAGEYRGLEVARIVRAVDDGEPILEVGVGRHDRHLTAMMHGDLDGRASIARVVEQLREIRRPDPPNHPLATLVPERWLRATVLADPAWIGCDQLTAAPAATPRDRLRPRGIAAAVGTRAGEAVVAVHAVGVDLEAPVQAADARSMLDPDATLLLVTPARDALPVTRALVSDLLAPAEVVIIEGDWRR